MAVDPNRRRVAIAYTGDDGQPYALVTRRNHAEAVGAVAPLGGAPPIPTRWVPRHVYGKQILAGRDRVVRLVIPTEVHPLWTGAANTFSVPGFTGTFDVTGRVGERRSNLAPSFNGVAEPASERVAIAYTADDSNVYKIVTTRGHAAAVGATGAGASDPNFPKAWTPRHYYLASTDLTGSDQKAMLVEPNPDAEIWESDGIFEFTIPGLGTFATTGRAAEDRPRPAPPYAG